MSWLATACVSALARKLAAVLLEGPVSPMLATPAIGPFSSSKLGMQLRRCYSCLEATAISSDREFARAQTEGGSDRPAPTRISEDGAQDEQPPGRDEMRQVVLHALDLFARLLLEALHFDDLGDQHVIGLTDGLSGHVRPRLFGGVNSRRLRLPTRCESRRR